MMDNSELTVDELIQRYRDHRCMWCGEHIVTHRGVKYFCDIKCRRKARYHLGDTYAEATRILKNERDALNNSLKIPPDEIRQRVEKVF